MASLNCMFGVLVEKVGVEDFVLKEMILELDPEVYRLLSVA